MQLWPFPNNDVYSRLDFTVRISNSNAKWIESLKSSGTVGIYIIQCNCYSVVGNKHL